jgi:hypothetical protein
VAIVEQLTDAVKEFLSGMAEPDKLRLVFRVGSLLKRGIYNGVILFVLSSCTITISAVYMRLAIINFYSFHQQYKSLWRSGELVVPGKGENSLVLMTALTLVKQGTPSCATATADCEFLSDIVRLMQTALEDTAGPMDPAAASRHLGSISATNASTDWLKLFQSDADGLEHAKAIGPLSKLAGEPANDAMISRAYTRFSLDDAAETTPRASEAFFLQGSPPPIAEIYLARIFDDVVQGATARLSTSASEIGGYECLRVYLITPSGSIVVWTNRRLQSPVNSSAIAALLLAFDSPSFSGFLMSQTLRSPLIGIRLDPQGFGLSMLECTHVSSNGTMRGSICADMTVPVDSALTGLRRSELLTTTEADSDQLHPTEIHKSDLALEGKSGDQLFQSENLPQPARFMLTTAPTLDRPQMVDDGGWLLPIGFKGKRYFFAYVSSRWPTSAYIDLGIATSLFILMVGIAVTSAYVVREAALHRERIRLLNGLRVGVISVTTETTIAEGNDYAEEIFKRTLPKLGPDAGPETKLSDLIDVDNAVVLAGATTYWRISSIDIKTFVSDDKPCSFFAKSASSNYWVEISGTPIINWRRDRELLCTIAFVAPTESSQLNSFLSGRERAI